MPTIQLKNVRLAFPELFEAKKFGDGGPSFSCAFLLPKNHPQVKEINAAIDQAATDKWGAKATGVVMGLRKSDKVCLHDGDTKAQYNGYAGNLFLNARSPASKKPLVIDRDKSPLVASDGRPYGGCYVNASIEIYAQDNSYGKRVNADLRGVQFMKDGESFGGGSVAGADDFDDLGDQGDEDSDLA